MRFWDKIKTVHTDPQEKLRQERLKWIVVVNSVAWILYVAFDLVFGQSAFGWIFLCFDLVLLAISVPIGLKLYRGDHW